MRTLGKFTDAQLNQIAVALRRRELSFEMASDTDGNLALARTEVLVPEECYQQALDIVRDVIDVDQLFLTRPELPQPKKQFFLVRPRGYLVISICVFLMSALAVSSYSTVREAFSKDPTLLLYSPYKTTARVTDRMLEISYGIDQMSWVERKIANFGNFYPDESSVGAAIEEYERVLANLPSTEDNTKWEERFRSRLAVLYAERGDYFNSLSITKGLPEDFDVVRHLIGVAYGHKDHTFDVSFNDVHYLLLLESHTERRPPSTFVEDLLRIRYYQATHDPRLAEATDWFSDRNRSIAHQSTLLQTIEVALFFIGLYFVGMLLLKKWRPRPEEDLDQTFTNSIWRWSLILTSIVFISTMASIVIWVVSAFVDSKKMGLTFARGRGCDILRYCFIGTGLGVVATLSISLACSMVGYVFPWQQGISEYLIWASPSSQVKAIVFSVIVAPFGEEIIFRGMIINTLRKHTGFILAAVVSVAIFTLLHAYSIPGLIHVASTGVIASYLYYKSQSLWPCIWVHFINNAIYVAFWSFAV